MATFYNQATLSYSGGVVNSNITTGEIIEVLSASKTAVVNEYSQGSDVTYVINIVNSGNTAFTGLTVTDDLGAYTFGTETLRPLDYVDGSLNYFINGVIQPTPTVTSGNELVISGINVPAGGVVTLIYTARVNNFAPPSVGGEIVNTAVVSGGGITDITVTETVTAAVEPLLTITKSVSPSTVAENGQITYTFVIQNIGNTAATATDNVVVTDTFDPILSGLSVTYNGTAWTSPDNYTYDETTGQFTTVLGEITVPEATYAQDAAGNWVIDPGVAVITVTGTI
ncbi:MAG: hypothetical protein J6L96_07980 [Clostridia bacterium]|nr:hypothetical protein [Clostridia bacterium]